MSLEWTRFPSFSAQNNLRQFDMPLNSVNYLKHSGISEEVITRGQGCLRNNRCNNRATVLKISFTYKRTMVNIPRHDSK